MGFKRSVKRMQQIETRLRDGHGAERHHRRRPPIDIVQSITSFALYGFPESHAASFALLVYASAYLKAHFPAAFYTALLNNQPMGFYHPATLVKDAQRHGVHFAPVDVQIFNWTCFIPGRLQRSGWDCGTCGGCARRRGSGSKSDRTGIGTRGHACNGPSAHPRADCAFDR